MFQLSGLVSLGICALPCEYHLSPVEIREKKLENFCTTCWWVHEVFPLGHGVIVTSTVVLAPNMSWLQKFSSREQGKNAAGHISLIN